MDPEKFIEVTLGVYILDAELIPEVTPDLLVYNANAADTTNANQLRTGGGLGLALTGADVTVGVWDGGAVRNTHTEFTNGNRVTVIDSGSNFSDHSTHVAGTIGARGANGNARCMADGVAIRSRDNGNDAAEYAADADIVDLSNHSYGYLRGWHPLQIQIGQQTVWADFWTADRVLFATEDPQFGKYTQNANVADTALGVNLMRPRVVDDVLFQNPNVLGIWAGGNDGDDAFQGLLSINGVLGYFAYSSTTGNYNTFFAAASAPPGDGNSGTGFDSLPQTQVAKNSLVVGAIDDVLDDPYDAGDITMAAFSSWGPTDDGRIKPDLVADGVNVFSSEEQADNDYGTQSGTSMAAPNVTGSAALLLEHYANLHDDPNDPDDVPRPRSASLKGTLIHTAFDAGNEGPDYRHGWGLVDAAAAATFLTNTVTPTGTDRLVEETYAGMERKYDVISHGTGPLKVTIVWTDPAPTTLPGAGLDDATSVLVNDLDIWITYTDAQEQTTTFRPWTLDPASPNNAAVRTVRNDRDNVEQVLIDEPAAGEYTIHVGRDPTQATFNQDYSLLVSGIDAAPQVTKVWLDYSGTSAAPLLEILTGSEFSAAGEPIAQQIMPVRIGGVFDTVKLEFSETVDIQKDDLQVLSAGGCTGATVLPFATGEGSFTVLDNTATWKLDLGTLNPKHNPLFHTNQILLKLDSDKVSGVIDNPPNTLQANELDGEWINPAGILDITENDRFASGNGMAGSDFEFRITVLRSDLNRDGALNAADIGSFIKVLNPNPPFAIKQFDEGDVNSDGVANSADIGTFIADLRDLGNPSFRSWVDCSGIGGGGASLMGGGEGGGEAMLGGGLEAGAVDEVLGESLMGGGIGEELFAGESGGGGEALLSGDPARIYITTSGSTSGGGALPGTVPSVQLSGPTDSVTFYVWANTGAYDFMAGYGLDIRATNAGVVKATASTLYNPNIVATNYGNMVMGTRWPAANVDEPAINPDGVGAAALANGAGAFSYSSSGGSGVNDAWDGTDSPFGRLDELYDATSGAFLVQSITLEALSGSGGQSTDVVLYVGDMAFSLDNLVETSYLTFGLGTNEVANNQVGETDGTTHAAISVAAQGPSALVVRASSGGSSVASRRIAIEGERERVATVHATAMPSIRQSRRESLQAVDQALERMTEARASRRPLYGSRAASHVATDSELKFDALAS